MHGDAKGQGVRSIGRIGEGYLANWYAPAVWRHSLYIVASAEPAAVVSPYL
jgi:hypothetical protein